MALPTHTTMSGSTQPTSLKTLAVMAISTANHRSVEELFEQFAQGTHKRRDKEEQLKVAAVEQVAFTWLVDQLKARATDEEFCDVKIVVLREYIRHHVQNEVRTLTPHARGWGMEDGELCQILQNVQQNLQTELTLDQE